jgi:hypothetical protein
MLAAWVRWQQSITMTASTGDVGYGMVAADRESALESIQARNRRAFRKDSSSMKRLIPYSMIGLLTWATLGLTGAPLEPDVPHRYLIVLENSARMDRQRDVALDTVHHLILSGIQGRIRDGDVLGIWTFRQQLKRDQFRALTWSSGRARDAANAVYRTLRDVGFAEEPDLDLAMAGVTAAAQATDQLTVFLVVSGTQQIHGSSFDTEINQVYQQHAAAMRKNQKPFVTVLVIDQGRTVAHATNPGGGQIYIPPIPEVPAPVEADPVPATPTQGVTEPVADREATTPDLPEQPVVEPAAVEPAPKPRILTVDEIQRQLREAEEERIRRQAEMMALEPPSAPEEPSIPSTDEPERRSDPAVRARTEQTESPGIQVENLQPPAISEEAAVEAALVEEPVEIAQADRTEVETPLDQNTGPEPITGRIEPTGTPRWGYMAGGVGLLIVAGLLSFYMYQRSRPRRARPSAISRSMDHY